MAENTEDAIDLSKLSQRELLIQVCTKVDAMQKLTAEQANKQAMTDIQLAVITTKIQMWCAIIGFVSGIGGAIMMLFITKATGK